MSPIANMLTMIKNAQAVGKEQVSVPHSNVKFKIAQILKDGGFIQDVEKKKKKSKNSEFDYLSITLKYDEDKKPVIGNFKLISKPSRHMYVGVKDIKLVHSGQGIAVISTSKGIMSSREARKNNLGGEMLFEVW